MDFVESENNVRPYLRVKLENITLDINFLAIDPGHLATTGFIDIFWESPKNFTPRLLCPCSIRPMQRATSSW